MNSFILFTFIILTLCLIPEKNKDRSFYLIVSLAFLCFITSFRGYDIGNDTHAYYRFFENIVNGVDNVDERIEPGYRFLNLIIAQFSVNYTVFLLITSLILFYALYRYIKSYGFSDKLYVVLFWCFSYVAYVSPLRQSLALSIALLSMPLLFTKRSYLFIIPVLLAATFHKTAIVCLAYLLFIYFRPTSKRIMLLVCSLVLLMLSGAVSGLNDYMDDYYARYLSVQSGMVAAIFNTLMGLTPLLLDKTTDQNHVNGISPKMYSFLRWSSVSYSALYLMSIYSSGMGRLAYYFLPMMLSYWVYTILTNRYYSRRILSALLMCIIISYRVATLILRPEWNSFFPYSFVWS